MAKIGLIDCDSHNYPNLPLMKISAYHKAQRLSLSASTGIKTAIRWSPSFTEP